MDRFPEHLKPDSERTEHPSGLPILDDLFDIGSPNVNSQVNMNRFTELLQSDSEPTENPSGLSILDDLFYIRSPTVNPIITSPPRSPDHDSSCPLIPVPGTTTAYVTCTDSAPASGLIPAAPPSGSISVNASVGLYNFQCTLPAFARKGLCSGEAQSMGSNSIAKTTTETAPLSPAPETAPTSATPGSTEPAETTTPITDSTASAISPAPPSLAKATQTSAPPISPTITLLAIHGHPETTTPATAFSASAKLSTPSTIAATEETSAPDAQATSTQAATLGPDNMSSPATTSTASARLSHPSITTTEGPTPAMETELTNTPAPTPGPEDIISHTMSSTTSELSTTPSMRNPSTTYAGSLVAADTVDTVKTVLQSVIETSVIPLERRAPTRKPFLRSAPQSSSAVTTAYAHGAAIGDTVPVAYCEVMAGGEGATINEYSASATTEDGISPAEPPLLPHIHEHATKCADARQPAQLSKCGHSILPAYAQTFGTEARLAAATANKNTDSHSLSAPHELACLSRPERTHPIDTTEANLTILAIAASVADNCGVAFAAKSAAEDLYAPAVKSTSTSKAAASSPCAPACLPARAHIHETANPSETVLQDGVCIDVDDESEDTVEVEQTAATQLAPTCTLPNTVGQQKISAATPPTPATSTSTPALTEKSRVTYRTKDHVNPTFVLPSASKIARARRARKRAHRRDYERIAACTAVLLAAPTSATADGTLTDPVLQRAILMESQHCKRERQPRAQAIAPRPSLAPRIAPSCESAPTLSSAHAQETGLSPELSTVPLSAEATMDQITRVHSPGKATTSGRSIMTRFLSNEPPVSFLKFRFNNGSIETLLDFLLKNYSTYEQIRKSTFAQLAMEHINKVFDWRVTMTQKATAKQVHNKIHWIFQRYRTWLVQYGASSLGDDRGIWLPQWEYEVVKANIVKSAPKEADKLCQKMFTFFYDRSGHQRSQNLCCK